MPIWYGVNWEQELKPIMKEAGFHKKGRSWYLKTAETVAVLSIQMSQYGGGDFYINLGILVKAIESIDWPPEYKCHLRTPLSSLMPDPYFAAKVFLIGNEPIGEELRRKAVREAVTKCAIPFLRIGGSIAGIRELIHANRILVHAAGKKLLDFLGIPIPPPEPWISSRVVLPGTFGGERK